VAAAGVVAARESGRDHDSYENERVREFEPASEATSHPAPSGPGVAAATPVKIEWPSDLQQVESDPGKVSSTGQEMEQQPVLRPKRVRQAPQAVDDGPLVQIETDGAASAADQKEPATPR